MEIELKNNSRKHVNDYQKKYGIKNFYLIDNETKLTNTHRLACGRNRHRFYDNLLRYEKQI